MFNAKFIMFSTNLGIVRWECVRMHEIVCWDDRYVENSNRLARQPDRKSIIVNTEFIILNTKLIILNTNLILSIASLAHSIFWLLMKHIWIPCIRTSIVIRAGGATACRSPLSQTFNTRLPPARSSTDESTFKVHHFEYKVHHFECEIHHFEYKPAPTSSVRAALNRAIASP